MSHVRGRADGIESTQSLIEELLRTAFVFHDVMASLLEEMPEGAFPGEDNGAVLLEMVVGTCRPAVEAAGEEAARQAIALVAAVGDRFLHDLRAAAELARGDR